MNGGMTRAAAHGAIAVLAGLLFSTASAQAADLGGNCCADLEERIAELEATVRELERAPTVLPARIIADEEMLHPPPQALPKNPWDEPEVHAVDG